MLETVLDNLNNYFIVDGGDHTGHFVINNGIINADFLQEDQYFKVTGSVFNDGVYKYKSEGIEFVKNEEFDGTVSSMAVPKAVISLSEEIGAWCATNAPSAYVSEAFGGYSRTRASSVGTGAPVSWEDVFRARLNRWRKL